MSYTHNIVNIMSDYKYILTNNIDQSHDTKENTTNTYWILGLTLIHILV